MLRRFLVYLCILIPVSEIGKSRKSLTAVVRKAVVVVLLLLTASVAKATTTDTSVTIDFERFPGPDGVLGTADDTFPLCDTGGICDLLGNQFAGMGITFTSGLLEQGDLFPGSRSSNHFVSSSPPDVTFSIPVTGISITSYSFWTATLYALDESSNVIVSNTLTNPDAGSSFFLGTLSVSASRPIHRFTVLPAGCQIGGSRCDPILNLDNLVLTSAPTSEGPRWVKIGPEGIVSIDPVLSETLYVVETYSGSVEGGYAARLFQSLDAGATWTLMTEHVPPSNFGVTILVSPEGPNTLYAYPYGLGDIFKSGDGGKTWTLVQTGDVCLGCLINAMVAAPTSPTALYFSGEPLVCWGCSGKGIFKSTDLGHHWKLIGPPGHYAWKLAVAPGNPSWLYGCNGPEILRSSDGGGRWVIMPSPNTSHAPPFPMAVDPVTPTTLYLAHFEGVFKSTNAGADWKLSTAGLPPAPGYINDIAIDPLNPDTLYVATHLGVVPEDGVYRSTDGGSTWTALSSGLKDLYVFNLVVDSTGRRIYASTSSGLFVLDLSQRMTVEPSRHPSTPRVIPPRGH